MKEKSNWHSERLREDVELVRWGVMGQPVLLYPTAGGDAEECERFHMLDVLSDLLEAQRIKVYSVDSIAGRAWATSGSSTTEAARIQNDFDGFIYHEVVSAIRTDCEDENIEVMVAGASLGAFNALASICRHPDVFSKAICMSGSYDMSKFQEGPISIEYYYSSPLHFVPNLEDGDQLRKLRERFILLTHGDGRWEDPSQSWKVAECLGAQGIPNRVDAWGEEWDHDWPTWREMLPKYLDELVD